MIEESATGASTVVTVTLNPSVDVAATVDAVVPDLKLRCDTVSREPGGGGLNVARVAKRLGASVRAVAVVGGAMGQQLLDLAVDERLPVIAVWHDGETRESLSVTGRTSGRQYRFLLPGPPIDATVIDEVRSVVATAEGLSCLVISGSMPLDSPPDGVLELVTGAGDATVVIDTSGPALVAALDSGATVVKPSAAELAAVVGRELRTEPEVLAAAREILDRSSVGALLVSVGAGGAFLLGQEGAALRLRAPAVQPVSAVGAGDSMVGGLTAGLSRGEDLVDAAVLGVAAGTAAVLTPGSQLCDASWVAELLPQVVVERIE